MFSRNDTGPCVAYFSMEVGLESAMPTYSGGLGVLAGDTLRAAADAGVPMVGVTLMHHNGLFQQHLDRFGNQREEPSDWAPHEFLDLQPTRASITIENRRVQLQAWLYPVRGVRGHVVPVYFLDAKLPENSEWDQHLTDYLYGGDPRYRLCQEVVLGMGGVAMLRALGYDNLQTFHMNEGHSSLLTVALLEEQAGGAGLAGITRRDVGVVRQRCVFTTHTPVPAGHDQFPMSLAEQVLGRERSRCIEQVEGSLNGVLNMTNLALALSRYVNGVSMRHEEISRGMFPNYPINSITNGVHALSWASPPFRDLFDLRIPEWRRDNHYLRYAVFIPVEEIQQAHREAKRRLLAEVERRTGVAMGTGIFTIGFARRATLYKRADLLFSNIDRLKRIVTQSGPIQVIYAGKAHPKDEAGKQLIRRIFQARAALEDYIRIVYLEDYDMELGRLLCSGVDLWLNTPQKPHEASGTSGMKAALNGVPSLSVLDGWWVEGCVEGTTGWAIGEDGGRPSNIELETKSLYDKLEYLIVPTFYTRPSAYAEIMRWAITLNGSFFTAQRMLAQYLQDAYTITPATATEPIPVTTAAGS